VALLLALFLFVLARITEPADSLLLRPDDVARELRLSRASVYNLMRSGRLASVKVLGARRIRRSDLADFVARQTQDGWAEGGGADG
jgi:excisionase family DNA binding protein